MKKNTNKYGVPFLFIVLFVPNIAFACPEGQHRGLFGWCYPNIGGDVGRATESIKRGHRYCVKIPVAYNVVECRGCWSMFGGEGGRGDCAVRMCNNQCSVDYGACEEPRNSQHCSRIY